MVSKIAVMALVAIVAVPILLGYGLNIQTDSYSGWEEDGSSQNLTNYLASIEDASKRNYTDADIYQFNSNIFYEYAAQVYPVYEKVSTTKTPVRLAQEYYPTPGNPLIRMGEYYSQGTIDGGYDASNYYSITISLSGGSTYTFDHLKSWYWVSDGSTASIDFAITEPGANGGYIDAGYDYLNIVGISSSYTGTPAGYWKAWNWQNTSNSYADISKGYRLNMESSALATPIPNIYDYYMHGLGLVSIYPSGICKEMVMTFNLDSITESSYYLALRFANHNVGVDYGASITLEKRTTDGNVEWYYTTYGDPDEHPLYYNPDLSSNTYQLYLNGDTGGEFRYVGAWTDVIRESESLITYPFEYEDGWLSGDYIQRIDVLGRTPIIRIDRASVAAYEYKIIRDTTYNPYEFKINPVTKLTNVVESGSSLIFGGITYAVDNGQITVDSESISLNGIKLSSVFTGNAYDNTINGKVVSTTLTPSSIVFNGDWSMQVNTTAQKYVEKETTKWIPGQFAWQGMDDNFLVAGLITSLAAFVGLAIYGRRSGAKVLPLLLVCGGAAFMFLLML